jgi:hypothetical protein
MIPLKNLHGGASAHCRFPYSYTYEANAFEDALGRVA